MAQYDENGKYIRKASVSAKTDVKVIIEKTVTNGKTQATVTKVVNGVSASEIFKGTDAEVQAKIDAMK